MRASKAFPSNYLKAADLDDQDVTLTISKARMEDIGQGNKKEEKLIIYFEEEEKGVVLNKTNANVLTEAYGDETDDWIGEPVTLYEKQVEFEGKEVPAIRMKIPKRGKATNEKARKPKEDDPPRGKGGKGRKREDDEIPF